MHDLAPVRDMTVNELAAWNGLIAGEMDALADVLEAGDGVLHPILQRWLVKLIRGTVEETDFRLTATRHPDLKNVADGPHAKRQASLISLRTARIVALNGGFEEGQTAGAFRAAQEETGLKLRTVIAHWTKHKAFLRVMLTRGVIGSVKPR